MPSPHNNKRSMFRNITIPFWFLICAVFGKKMIQRLEVSPGAAFFLVHLIRHSIIKKCLKNSKYFTVQSWYCKIQVTVFTVIKDFRVGWRKWLNHNFLQRKKVEKNVEKSGFWHSRGVWDAEWKFFFLSKATFTLIEVARCACYCTVN